MISSQRENELKTYFQHEYKNDWIWAYSLHIEKQSLKKKNIFKTIFCTIFTPNKG